MSVEMNTNNRKYNILKFLKKLPYNEYAIAKRKLPFACKVSKRTFERWLYVTRKERLEVSADKLAIIARFFDCSIGELLNHKIPKHNTYTLKRLHNQKLIKQLNLTKWENEHSLKKLIIAIRRYQNRIFIMHINVLHILSGNGSKV